MANIRTNAQYNEIRRNLTARSLYSPTNQYTIDNPKIVDTINTIASFIPGKSFDLTNTVIGRLMGPNTPIAQLGLKYYSRGLTQRVTNNVAKTYIPKINLNNLFDGDPKTKLITPQIDYQITRREDQNIISRILEDIGGATSMVNPFKPTSTNIDYIRNTGKGQLIQMYANLDRNIYRQSDLEYLNVSTDEGFEINTVTKALLRKQYYPTNDLENFFFGQEANDEVRSEIVLFREEVQEEKIAEYGSPVFKSNLGKTKINVTEIAENLQGQERDRDFEFPEDSFGFDENIDNQIVWGRDTDLRKFGVRGGALLYTKGLLQAKGPRGYFDQTKKKITNKDGSISYAGSPLTRTITGEVNRSRQNTILDPYGSFAKAIRFQGNSLYNGPAESVINKTVIPKIHPVIDEQNQINNRNMVFSIENLAYILNDEGYLGDTLGTKVPKSEVGPNRGRLMWFAPYDVEVSETAIAKYETTQFIGRSEPVYTYQSSERPARISFKLIIDYPPQVDGRSHAEAAKFFAFGGNFTDAELKNFDVNQLKADLQLKKDQLGNLKPVVEQNDPDVVTGDYVNFFFSNDNSSVQFDIDNGYEDGILVDADPSGAQDLGLNAGFEDKIETLVTQILNEETYEYYNIRFEGNSTKLFKGPSEKEYNQALALNRANSLKLYTEAKLQQAIGKGFEQVNIKTEVVSFGSNKGSTKGASETVINEADIKPERNAKIVLLRSEKKTTKPVQLTPQQVRDRNSLITDIQALETKIAAVEKAQRNERIFNLKTINDKRSRGFETMKKLTFSPVFHSQTPEDFHRRLTFLHQCTRQGNSIIDKDVQNSGIPVAKNSVFGRPPICVLRLGDMYHTKMVIETIDFDFTDSIWDINPEGLGMQFMIADISMSVRIIGGASLKTAIDVIQNAESFNYYANSTFNKDDVYAFARKVEDAQVAANEELNNNKLQSRFGTNNQ